MVVVDLGKDGVDVHVTAVGGDIDFHDVFDDAFFEQDFFEGVYGVGGGALAAANEEVVFIEYHDVAAFEADHFAPGGGGELLDVVEVDDASFFDEWFEDGVSPEDVAGDEVFAESGLFGGFGDDDVVVDGDGDVTGEDEVGDGVEEDEVFVPEVAGDEGFGEGFIVEFEEFLFVGLGEFFVVDDAVDHDDFVAFVGLECFEEELFGFEYVFFAEECFEDVGEYVVLGLHLGEVDDIVEEEFFGSFGGDTGDAFVGAVYDYAF